MYKIPHSKSYVGETDGLVTKEQVDSGMHATGEKTKEFEDKLSELIKSNYAKATTSGTTALHLALLSLNIKQGDEVILPSYVCQAVLNAVNYTKAKPILADIDSNFENGYNISAKTIQPLITNNTKAIIVPHMFGIPAELDPIIKLGIPIIEDCAQALGGDYNGKKLGSIGDIGIFSFYATKLISTGNGGMVTTNSEKLKQKLKILTTYDKTESYTLGYNYNMSDIQSSLGISQLNNLNKFIEKRKQIAEKYNKAFKDLNILLPNPNNVLPFRYVIMLKNKQQRDELQNKLKHIGINAEFPVFKPLHQYLNLNPNNFQNTELAHNTTLSIPIYPALTDKEVEYIIESVVSFLS